MIKVKYKPEIDGLRTIAVLSVIIYHINPNILPSGFVGVDIFLVISGYLITSIIIKSYKENDFSIYSFYIRRIKRIIPLTYFVLIVILIAGWFLSYPAIYRAEANSSLSALYFIANFRFALMGNYFNPSNDNPLLHLWSLSLEEQFYFIWPLVIGLLYKVSNGSKLFLICTFLLIVSLFFSFFFVNTESLNQYAYFILPTRMMGLLIGAGLASINIENIKGEINSNMLSVLGISLVFLSLFIIKKENYPGLYTLIPCIGSAFIILSSQANLTKSLLTNRVMTSLGKISFSLYMWHYPLLVFGKRFIKNNPYFSNDIINLFMYFVTLLLISTFSYYYIESFFRKKTLTNSKVIINIFIVPLLFLTVISLYISKSDGIPMRYALTDKMTRTDILGCHNSLLKDFCYLNDEKENKENLLLIGDSHAGSMGGFVALLSDEVGINALDASAGGCNFYSKSFDSNQCENVKIKISLVLKKKKITYIAIAKRYDGMTHEQVNKLLSYASNLSQLGYKVIMIKQVPKMTDIYKDKDFMFNYLAGKIPTFTFDIDGNFKKYNFLLDKLTNKNKEVMSLDFNNYLAKGDGSYRVLDDDGYPLYYDDDHLSAYGSEWLYHKYNNSTESSALKLFLTTNK